MNNLEPNKNLEKFVIVAGRIQKLSVKPSKRGDYALIELESNNSIIAMQFWNDTWGEKKIKTKLLELEASKKMFALSGILKWDDWKKKNVVFGSARTKIIEI